MLLQGQVFAPIVTPANAKVYYWN